MSEPANSKLKAKKLGVLIRDARQVSRKSLEECAQVIGVSPETFEAYELGQQAPSLPELEILAYSMQIPVDHFLSDDGLLAQSQPESPLELSKLIALRQKIIGVMLRQARFEKKMALEDVAEQAGIQAEVLQAYEFGQKPVPVPELNLLAVVLDGHLSAFEDAVGPVGKWANQQRNLQSFKDLDAGLQEFVSKPVNRPYLEIAKRLSEMPADRLRLIAETLLEITL